MKVILLADVRGSGKKGEVVKVSDGYAKNYLFPKNLAKEATVQAMRELDSEKESLHRKKELEKQEALKTYEIINGKNIEIASKVGENGKLFGSVTSKDISGKIKEAFGVNIDKHQVCLKEDIKAIGSYNFDVKVYIDVTAHMSLNVTG